MDPNQYEGLFNLIRGLDGRLESLRAAVHDRFNKLEQRVGALENQSRTNTAISRDVRRGPVHLPTGAMPTNEGMPPARRGRGTDRPSNRAPGGHQETSGHGYGGNATYLPFVIEAIALKQQHRAPDDQRTCSRCGGKPFPLDCFRNDHFRWCRLHQRPILPPHEECGRDYSGCLMVKWEVHPLWEEIVYVSYAAPVGLGSQGVQDLEEKFFPQEFFPHKWNRDGTFISGL